MTNVTFGIESRKKPFQGLDVGFVDLTQGCRLRSNPGLELANAFGVNAWPHLHELTHTVSLFALRVRGKRNLFVRAEPGLNWPTPC